jgi:hypothetical protein
LRAELGFAPDLLLPAGRTVFVRVHEKEARFVTVPGGAIAFNRLAFGEPETRGRGSLETAMQSGLFATEFGRGYYLGFIDRSPDFAAVTFTSRSDEITPTSDSEATAARAGFRALLGAGLSRAVSSASVIPGLRLGLRPDKGLGALLDLDFLYGQTGDFAEWQGLATIGLGWAGKVGEVRSWIGAYAGGGAIGQSLNDGGRRMSGAVLAGPLLGASAAVAPSVHVWSELQASVTAFRQNAQTELALLPSAWVGGALEF